MEEKIDFFSGIRAFPDQGFRRFLRSGVETAGFNFSFFPISQSAKKN